MTTLQTTAPAGMTGLACEPWSKGEIYAVAANWSQASGAVMVYGRDGWTTDTHGRQVADFRHLPADALESILLESIRDSGDNPDEWDVSSDVRDATVIGGAFAMSSPDLRSAVNKLRDPPTT